MAKVEIEYEGTVMMDATCNVCGDSLSATYYATSEELLVAPCETCNAKAAEEAVANM